jgi:signal transduction histidine kinase
VDDSELPPVFVRRLRQNQLIALDVMTAVAYTGVLLAFVDTAQPSTAGASMAAWVRFLVVAGIGLPIAVRRLWPIPVFGIVVAMTVASAFLHVVREPFVAAALALYLVALTEPRRWWVPTSTIGVISVIGLLAGSLTGAVGAPGSLKDLFGLIITGCAVMGGTWTVGRAVRARRAYAARSAEQLADRAVAQERLRIARELHDVVTHSMGLIAVKAGVANHVIQTRPEEAHNALRIIETTSRSALTEMRHMLGVLRSDTDGGEALTHLGPAPGLASLPQLAERTEMAGVRVDMRVGAMPGGDRGRRA